MVKYFFKKDQKDMSPSCMTTCCASQRRPQLKPSRNCRLHFSHDVGEVCGDGRVRKRNANETLNSTESDRRECVFGFQKSRFRIHQFKMTFTAFKMKK